VDFFGAQDRARRRTWRLAALFGGAVLALVVITNLLVALVYAWSLGLGNGGDPLDPVGPLRRLPAGYWFWITLTVVGSVALACLYKYLWLRGGGRAIAESLGGRPVSQGTTDPAERRLLNVVEEMAIASGLPVPPVYVIPQPSINAFAAGLNFGDAVIGVNEGTLAHLDRDELQGVIAHEFSHLLNGDSRLNLRLLALLHGILFIGLVGEGLLRGLGRGARSRRSSGSSRGGSAGLPILLLGLGLTLIGYTGTLFGKLIRAAVSRQREYLADAAAVQFTRNPPGIAGALKKIGGLAAGSRMPGPAAGEASHLFFGPVTNAWFSRLTATHPPLEERIRAIEPSWDGRFALVAPAGPAAPGGRAEADAAAGLSAGSLRPGLLPPASARPDPRQPARRPRPRPWWRPSAAWTTAHSTRPAGCWRGCRRSC
jgi:Zn-dependent protease with chaperone function